MYGQKCIQKENGVEKMKKRNNFFRSLRFRILIILIILGFSMVSEGLRSMQQ